MTEDVYETFRRILKERPRDLPEKMVDGYIGFLFRDKNGMPEVAMHWQHRFNHAVKRYNDIFKIQMPNITPHVCRHTYCSNQARAGMNPKTLQYLMGHSDIGVTMNTYAHLGLDDAKDEMVLDCQHFFRQIFLGYFPDIVQAFDTLGRNVYGDDYTSLHNPIVLSSVLLVYGMFHSTRILFNDLERSFCHCIIIRTSLMAQGTFYMKRF